MLRICVLDWNKIRIKFSIPVCHRFNTTFPKFFPHTKISSNFPNSVEIFERSKWKFWLFFMVKVKAFIPENRRIFYTKLWRGMEEKFSTKFINLIFYSVIFDPKVNWDVQSSENKSTLKKLDPKFSQNTVKLLFLKSAFYKVILQLLLLISFFLFFIKKLIFCTFFKWNIVFNKFNIFLYNFLLKFCFGFLFDRSRWMSFWWKFWSFFENCEFYIENGKFYYESGEFYYESGGFYNNNDGFH